jgi:hypothetical protein
MQKRIVQVTEIPVEPLSQSAVSSDGQLSGPDFNVRPEITADKWGAITTLSSGPWQLKPSYDDPPQLKGENPALYSARCLAARQREERPIVITHRFEGYGYLCAVVMGAVRHLLGKPMPTYRSMRLGRWQQPKDALGDAHVSDTGQIHVRGAALSLFIEMDDGTLEERRNIDPEFRK